MNKIEVYISIEGLKNYRDGKEVFGEMVPRKKINACWKLIIPFNKIKRIDVKLNVVSFKKK